MRRCKFLYDFIVKFQELRFVGVRRRTLSPLANRVAGSLEPDREEVSPQDRRLGQRSLSLQRGPLKLPHITKKPLNYSEIHRPKPKKKKKKKEKFITQRDVIEHITISNQKYESKFISPSERERRKNRSPPVVYPEDFDH